MIETRMEASSQEFIGGKQEVQEKEERSISQQFKERSIKLQVECGLTDRKTVKAIRDYHHAKSYVHGAMAKEILPYYFKAYPDKEKEWHYLSHYADGEDKIISRLAEELKTMRPIDAVNMALNISENDKRLEKSLSEMKSRIVDAFASGADASHDKLHNLMIEMTDWYWDDSRLPDGLESYEERSEYRKKEPEYIAVDNLRHNIAEVLTGMAFIG